MADILIDTSVWIEFFRKKEPWFSRVSDLLDHGAVISHGIVIAELLQCAASDKEPGIIRDLASVLEIIGDEMRTWLEAGSLSNRLRKRGVTVGLSDCLIACAAQSHGYAVMTLDAHFKSLNEELGIELAPF